MNDGKLYDLVRLSKDGTYIRGLILWRAQRYLSAKTNKSCHLKSAAYRIFCGGSSGRMPRKQQRARGEK